MAEGENKEKEIKPSLQEDIAKSKSPGYSNKDFGIDREEVEKYKNLLYGKGAKGRQIKNMSKSEKEISQKEDFGEEKKASFNFNKEIEGLINPPKGEEKVIKNDDLCRLALLATKSWNQTPERLDDLLKTGNDWYLDPKKNIPENEWEILAGLMNEKKSQLEYRQVKKISPEGEEEKLKGKEEFEKLQKKIEKLGKFGGKKGLTEEEVKETVGLLSDLAKTQKEIGIGGLMSGMEKPPSAKEDVGEFEKWFRQKIHALIEEYPDQSFETNWTLVYPLQQAINSLWPEKEELTFKDKKGTVVNYVELRRSLALELEAHRSLHNYIFLHRRVSGVEGCVAAAGFLERHYIEYLLKEEGVAGKLKELEKLGEEYKNIKTDLNLRKEERKIGMQEKLSKMLETQSNGWTGRVAGGLYSALNEAARHDVVLNESGDFFLGRLFNMPDWAERLWEGKWKRGSFPGFYKAVDLRVKSFWQEFLTKDIKTEENLKDWRELLEKYNIAVISADVDGKAIPLEKVKLENKVLKDQHGKPMIEGGKPINYSLKEAKFEEMELSKFVSHTDPVRFVDLSLFDADPIRKAILEPRGLLEEPGLGHIRKMWESFKHLKGAERSDWMREVMKQILWFFKDQTAPDVENLPNSLRKFPAKEVFPKMMPLLNEDIIHIVEGLTPPLIPPDSEKLLKDLIGGKTLRGFKKTGRTVFGVIGSMIGEGIKALFGLK